MRQIWLQALDDPTLKGDLEDLLRNTFIRSTLLKVINRMMAEEERMETTLAAYDNPSWAYKQADLNGARRAYTKMQGLLDLESGKTSA